MFKTYFSTQQYTTLLILYFNNFFTISVWKLYQAWRNITKLYQALKNYTNAKYRYFTPMHVLKTPLSQN